MMTRAEALATFNLPHYDFKAARAGMRCYYRFEPRQRMLIDLVQRIAYLTQGIPNSGLLSQLFGQGFYTSTIELCGRAQEEAARSWIVVAIVLPDYEAPLDDRL